MVSGALSTSGACWRTLGLWRTILDVRFLFVDLVRNRCSLGFHLMVDFQFLFSGACTPVMSLSQTSSQGCRRCKGTRLRIGSLLPEWSACRGRGRSDGRGLCFVAFGLAHGGILIVLSASNGMVPGCPRRKCSYALIERFRGGSGLMRVDQILLIATGQSSSHDEGRVEIRGKQA